MGPRGGCEVGVVLVSDARIRTLNRRYRGMDAATDVLAFPLDHPFLLGDVVISVETARRQARGRFKTELARLLIHGILHLLGYDHERSAAEARRMRRRETGLRRAVRRRPDVIG